MRWKKDEREWKRKFAWLPVDIGDTWIWLEHYWSADRGMWEQVATEETYREIIAQET